MFRNLHKDQKFTISSEICVMLGNLRKVQKFAQCSEICAKFRNLHKIQKFAKSKFRNLPKVQAFAQSSQICAMFRYLCKVQKFAQCKNASLRAFWGPSYPIHKLLQHIYHEKHFGFADNFLGTLHGLMHSWKQTEMFYKQYLSLSLVKSTWL